MHKLLYGLVVFFCLQTVASAAIPLNFTGKFTQGSLVKGQTIPSTKVLLNNRSVATTETGVFLLAFPRDAAEKATLRLIAPSGETDTKILHISPREWDIQRLSGLPPTMVTPDPVAEKRIALDTAQIKALRRNFLPAPYFESGFILPAKGRISGVFGSQRILNGKPKNPHNGLDIAGGLGGAVWAPAAGVVVLAAPDMYYTGNTVFIDHGFGLLSVYAHLETMTVQTGQHVKQGDALGTIGKTGRATGPHLHWGMTLGDTHIDPAMVLEALAKNHAPR
jgi:murein DD-endopeptidase MepM/ murein hydrolase activator NlpD